MEIILAVVRFVRPQCLGDETVSPFTIERAELGIINDISSSSSTDALDPVTEV